jgi:hypothetical protein
MKKTGIYPDQSQELLTLFEKAGNPSKLMCVPIDYAKKDHLVMFCNGNGEVLRKPFSVNNSVDGVKDKDSIEGGVLFHPHASKISNRLTCYDFSHLSGPPC